MEGMSASFSAVSSATMATQKPNLIFAMADQLRWDAVGYANPEFSGKSVQTPSLDRIASEGLSVEFSWSSTPTCTPARAGLLTGRRPWGHGMLGYGEVAPFYPQGSFPSILAAAGYQTMAIGKDHFGWNATTDAGINHGYEKTALYDGLGAWDKNSPHGWNGEFDDYDKWFQEEMPGKDPQATLDSPSDSAWNGWHGGAYVYDEKYHPTAWVGARAEAFLRAKPTSADKRPFLLKVSFHRPHSPYDPPQRLLDKVKADELPPMARCEPSVDGVAWCLRFRGNASLGDPTGCGDSREMWCGEALPTSDGVLGRRAYLASVAFVDEQVGRIHAALNETGLLRTTFLLWTADHGDGQGDMYHWRKGYPYEFSAHVPMLLRWPEEWAAQQPASARVALARGAVLRPPLVTELRDVFHTLLDAAGVASNASLVPAAGSSSRRAFDATDGKSMLCLLRDPSGATCDYAPNPGPWRTWLDLEHSTCYNNSNHWSALTDGATKYVFKAWDGVEQLFDLRDDPKETVDRAPDPMHAATLAKWRARMVAQFEAEQRGDGWVKGGKLVVRPTGLTYGPNYPGPTPIVEHVV
tara:strand:+ start:229 stop:1968 length:1740 start_codon:yes stop_codon:yes gene_type:complete